MRPNRPKRSIVTHDPLPSTFDSTTARVRCALCNDPDAEWANTDEGLKRLGEHAKAAHGGQEQYTVYDPGA